MLLKQKPANIRKWIARFYYFMENIYTPLEARVYCSQWCIGAIHDADALSTAH